MSIFGRSKQDTSVYTGQVDGQNPHDVSSELYNSGKFSTVLGVGSTVTDSKGRIVGGSVEIMDGDQLDQDQQATLASNNVKNVRRIWRG